MNTVAIVEALRRLLGILDNMETLTRSLGDAPSFDDIRQAVEARETLVCRMAGETTCLSQSDPQWLCHADTDPVAHPLTQQMRGHASAVAHLDQALTRIVKARMVEVGNALSGLSGSSRAALSYASHATYRSGR
jgi:hypothetical protein